MSLLKWFRGEDDEPRLSAAMKARLDELEEANRQTNKKLSELELDWSEWFNKFRLLYARLTKRVIDEEKKAADDAPRSTNGQDDPVEQRRLNEMVHQRLSRPRKNY